MKQVFLIALVFFTVTSASVFGADRAIEISITANPRSAEQLNRVSYVVQALIGRLVTEMAVGGFTLLQPKDGKAGYVYCVQLTSVANEPPFLGKLVATFEAVAVPQGYPVDYKVAPVESCPAPR